jgi:hypothetical protein
MNRVPVYHVSVPEYRFDVIEETDEKIDYDLTPWFGVEIPKVYVDHAPDFGKIGGKIDVCLKQHFMGRRVAVRAIGSEEHEGKGLDELVEIVEVLGHDRYDSKRKGDRYENVEGKHIDFFALDFEIEEDGKYFEQFIEPFYYWPIVDRENPIRIDLALIYDVDQLESVEHRYEGRESEIKRDGFVFRDPERKKEALLGMIKIL